MLLIREEYLLAYEAFVEGISEMESANRVLFTGHPGTGLWARHTVEAATNQTW